MIRLKNNFLYINLYYIQDLMTQLQFDIDRKSSTIKNWRTNKMVK